MNLAADPLLTKSRFLASQQCPKRLRRQCHSPIQVAPSHEIVTGEQVGTLAHRLFPGGVNAGATGNISAASLETEKLVADADVSAIFEASLGADRLFARVDILERLPRGAWGICEVKGTTTIKDHHYDDVAFQLYVARHAGLTVSRCEIIHVNKAYELSARGIDAQRYFQRVDVTKEVKSRLASMPQRVEEMLRVSDQKRMPKVEPWSHCGQPYQCKFWEDCTAKKPADWIFYLPNRSQKVSDALLEKKVTSIAKIPDIVKLTPKQTIVRDAHRS